MPETINKNMVIKIAFFYFLTILFSWSVFLIVDGILIPQQHDISIIRLIAFYGHMIAMMGPLLASITTLKYISKRKLLNIRWSNIKHYRYGFYFFFSIWLLPAIVWLQFGTSVHLNSVLNSYDVIFVISYLLIGWIAGVGEEYGWTGYILTELSDKIGNSKAVVVSGILRGIWHLPLFVIPIALRVFSKEKPVTELLLLTIMFAFQLSVSNIFFSALFGHIWYKTKSIPLIGWLHFQFDLLRDFALFFIIGFNGTIWFKFGWAIPFYFAAYIAFTKIAKEEGFSNYLEIFKTGIYNKK